MFTTRIIEATPNGLRRIVKVTNENTRTTNYVVHARSKLIPGRLPNGKFSSEIKDFCPATEQDAERGKATGWTVMGNFNTLWQARATAGIDTSPKRLAA